MVEGQGAVHMSPETPDKPADSSGTRMSHEETADEPGPPHDTNAASATHDSEEQTRTSPFLVGRDTPLIQTDQYDIKMGRLPRQSDVDNVSHQVPAP